MRPNQNRLCDQLASSLLLTNPSVHVHRLFAVLIPQNAAVTLFIYFRRVKHFVDRNCVIGPLRSRESVPFRTCRSGVGLCQKWFLGFWSHCWLVTRSCTNMQPRCENRPTRLVYFKIIIVLKLRKSAHFKLEVWSFDLWNWIGLLFSRFLTNDVDLFGLKRDWAGEHVWGREEPSNSCIALQNDEWWWWCFVLLFLHVGYRFVVKKTIVVSFAFTMIFEVLSHTFHQLRRLISLPATVNLTLMCYHCVTAVR